jgi:hypothetical protein
MPVSWKKVVKVAAVLLALVMGSALSGGGWAPEQEAHAIIGMPLTPLSFAGVARRTARRSAYYGGYGAYGAYGAYGGLPVGVVPALPAGCANVIIGGVPTYSCAGTYYRPYYSGPNLVYRPVVVP